MKEYGNENLGAFQPTRPLRGATNDGTKSTLLFQPTRPLRGATIMDWFGDTFFIISTHAPLAGRDFLTLGKHLSARIIQPTRPLRGATTQVLLDMMQRTIFQPTRPLRGATQNAKAMAFNQSISTHAPLAGRDCACDVLLRE